jgi:hypothetical protein
VQIYEKKARNKTISIFFGSSGKWSDRVVSMLPDEEGKQPKQQVQRITTLRGDKRRYASNKPSARETT